jgi:hypothetical protein
MNRLFSENQKNFQAYDYTFNLFQSKYWRVLRLISKGCSETDVSGDCYVCYISSQMCIFRFMLNQPLNPFNVVLFLFACMKYKHCPIKSLY